MRSASSGACSLRSNLRFIKSDAWLIEAQKKNNTLTNLRLGLLFEIPPSPVSREVVTCLATKCLFHLTFTLSLISDLPSPDMLSRRMYEHRVMEQLACWDSTLYSVSVGISREFSRRVIASHV